LRELIDMTTHPLGSAPADIFDAYVHRSAVPQHIEVVVAPRHAPARPIERGDVLIERALGEARLATMGVIADSTLAAPPPGRPPGRYVALVGNRTRLVLGPDGRAPANVLVVRPRLPARTEPRSRVREDELAALSEELGVRVDAETTSTAPSWMMAEQAAAQRLRVSVRTDFGVPAAGGGLDFHWAHGEAVRNANVEIVGTSVRGITNASGVVDLVIDPPLVGTHTLRVRHSVAVSDVDELAGPLVADPITGDLPARIYRPLEVAIVLAANGLTSASVDATDRLHGSIGNRTRAALSLDHLPLDWKPTWMKAPAKSGENPRTVTTVDLIVCHHTGGPLVGPAINTFLSPDQIQSAHYLIDTNGHVIKMVADRRIANQTGTSKWKGDRNLNSRSIGIEIVNESGDYPAVQMNAAVALIQRLMGAYSAHIPAHRIVGHSDIATHKPNPPTVPDWKKHVLSNRRAGDPGRRFEWDKLEALGLGMVPSVGVMLGHWVRIVLVGQTFFELRRGDRDASGSTQAIYGGTAQPGVTATHVADMQRDLEHVGYAVLAPGTAHGTFDEWTEQALKMFQRHFFSGSRRTALPDASLGRLTQDTFILLKGARAAVP
jgi:N-acetyl-anhydromuramyl-L-alanine amidase AmpD